MKNKKCLKTGLFHIVILVKTLLFNVVSGFHPALNSIRDHSTTCSVSSLSILIGIAIFPQSLRLTYDLLTTNYMVDDINCQYYPFSLVFNTTLDF